MTQIASSHNQPAFKDIWGHLRSFVKCGYYSIVSCTKIRVSHFEILTPSAVWTKCGFFWKVDIFEKKDYFSEIIDIFFETKDFHAISLSDNPYFHTLKFGNYPSQCSTNHSPPLCLTNHQLLPIHMSFPRHRANGFPVWLITEKHVIGDSGLSLLEILMSHHRARPTDSYQSHFWKLGEKKSVFTIND